MLWYWALLFPDMVGCWVMVGKGVGEGEGEKWIMVEGVEPCDRLAGK